VYLCKIGTATISTFVVAEYNSSQEYIKRDNNKQQAEYTVPSDVSYIKISVYKEWVNNGQDYPNFPLYSYISYREHYLTGDKNPPLGIYTDLRQGTSLQGKNIAYFGDSIIGFGNVCKYLKMMTGAANVYNVGFGGCRMARHDVNYGAFSMYNLAAAIVSGDYSAQIAALPNTSLGLDGTLSLNNLTTIDWTTIDIILVHYGTNDWTSGAINIGVGDITDTLDFKGMMEKSIQTILSAYPKIKIVFDTITWRDVTNIPGVTGNDFLTATNSKGNTPAEFNAAIEDVCKKYYLQSNNLTFGLFNYYNKNVYLQDTTHPNDRGWQLMAEKVANLL
jgi:lysophospholipase L1-like esterase